MIANINIKPRAKERTYQVNGITSRRGDLSASQRESENASSDVRYLRLHSVLLTDGSYA